MVRKGVGLPKGDKKSPNLNIDHFAKVDKGGGVQPLSPFLVD